MSRFRVFWWKPFLDKSFLKNSIPKLRLLPSIRIFYSNYGDALNPIILSKVVGNASFVWSPQEFCNFTGIGSILNTVIRRSRNDDLVVWGSGLRNELSGTSEINKSKKFTYLALRGKYSAAALKCTRNIAFGDPGLLVSMLVEKKTERESSQVFIPHFSFLMRKESDVILENLVKKGFRICFPYEDVTTILDSISDAKYVVSSAMHVLISADSLGIPAIRLVDLSDSESEFKYLDYYSGVGDKAGWPTITLKDFVCSEEVSDELVYKANCRLDTLKNSLQKSKEELLEVLIRWRAMSI